jgi:hypothetical protein
MTGQFREPEHTGTERTAEPTVGPVVAMLSGQHLIIFLQVSTDDWG